MYIVFFFDIVGTLQLLSNSLPLGDEDIRPLKEKITYVLDSVKSKVLPDLAKKIEENMSLSTTTTPFPVFLLSKGRGRPEVVVDIEQVIHLRCLGFKWNTIADIMGVSIRTLHRRRQDANIGDIHSFTEISDDEICRQLLLMKSDFPDIGERMAVGLFRSRGMIVPRRRIRDAFHRVDPINTSLRWHVRIKRRTNSVPGPMSLWHIGACY